MRIAFETPRTPARDSPIGTSGTEACRSARKWRTSDIRANLAPPSCLPRRLPSSSRSRATASGFARTLQRLDEIEEPAKRYVEMIGAATDQLAELLDLLSAVARIQGGRFEPQLRAAHTRELVDAAA